jgi:hypothetical protein
VLGFFCLGMPVEVNRVCNDVEMAVFSCYFCEMSVGIFCLGMSVEVNRVCNDVEMELFSCYLCEMSVGMFLFGDVRRSE